MAKRCALSRPARCQVIRPAFLYLAVHGAVVVVEVSELLASELLHHEEASSAFRSLKLSTPHTTPENVE